jgi:hypothetical protein
MLIVNSLNPPNRYGNNAVTRVLFIFEKKCTMSQPGMQKIFSPSIPLPPVGALPSKRMTFLTELTRLPAGRE